MSYNDFTKGESLVPSQDERLLACLIYVSSLFTVFIAPLVIWLIKKDDSAYIDYHGREYFNFLISYSVYSLVSLLLIFVLIGFVTIWLVGIYAFVFTIVAAVKAYEGDMYRIPLIFRIIR